MDAESRKAKGSGMLEILLEIETQGWRTLSSEGCAAQEFYKTLLCDDAVMLFSGGLRLVGRENILASLATQPWKHFRIDDPMVVRVSDATEVLIYRVTAQRDDNAPYHALVSSTYTQVEGGWRLALHQHTPV